jgi:hypothetical protein
MAARLLVSLFPRPRVVCCPVLDTHRQSICRRRVACRITLCSSVVSVLFRLDFAAITTDKRTTQMASGALR